MLRTIALIVAASVFVAVAVLFFRSTSVKKAPSTPKPVITKASYKPSATTGFALVELYTSEGCSSCPPADALLTKTIESAQSQNIPVYALAFHVDYWNNLGWTDPFSSTDYSNRQREYAKTFQSNSVYTPQLIVNGSSEMIGSDASKVHNAIESALSQTSQARLQLETPVVTPGSIDISYHLSSVSTGTVLHLALVQKSGESNVVRGENSGRELRHSNIVRAFTTAPSTGEGTVTIAIPNGLSLDPSQYPQYQIVAFAQEHDAGKVIAAASSDL